MTRSHDFLAVESIEASYGQAGPALRGVSLTVEEGSIVALLGSNGAGKSTTLRAISNLLGPQRGALRGGSIRWRGESTAGLDPADLVRRGIVQVLEGRHVFGQLTVEENLRTGGFLRRPSRRQLADDLERVYAWFPRLRDRRSAKAGLTSGGEQQMVAIGRALMTRPTLVLLDEPSMGFAPIIVGEIFEIIRRLNREEGVSFLLAEQSANLVLAYADRAYVLESGRVVEAGPAADLAASGRLGEIYLGGAATATRH
ncbi:ABC transporter ATP-binding protein [Methylobacterium sp. CM6244]